jgi:ribonuclease G
MAKRKLVVSAEGSETRVALLEGADLAEYFLERKHNAGMAGNIYRGKISRVLPGMQAAFVDLGPGIERKAYLHVAEILGAGDEKRLFEGYESEEDEESGSNNKKKRTRRTRKVASRRKIEDLVKEGQNILVQIVKESVGEKGARITGNLSLPGRHCVFIPNSDRVGVSHRISSEKERRRLRKLVEEARPEGAGFIIRTAADGADADELKDDVDYLIRHWEEIGRREKGSSKPGLLYQDLDLTLRTVRDMLRDDVVELIIDDEEQFDRAVRFTKAFMPGYVERVKRYEGRTPIFDAYGIESQLRASLSRTVPLKSGGSLVIDQGEALTAIDVNTGSYVGKEDLETTITANNLEACEAVARQLRLRNLGGIIVIDFVDMDKASNRQLVWEKFNEELAKDTTRSNVTKISELGLVEMTRKRTRESLHQLLTEPCPTCEGRGVVKSTTTVGYEVMREVRRVGSSVDAERIQVECSPQVATWLQQHERDYLDHLEKRFHKLVEIKGTRGLPPDQYKVEGKIMKIEEPSKAKPKSNSRSKSRSAAKSKSSAKSSAKSSKPKSTSTSRTRSKSSAAKTTKTTSKSAKTKSSTAKSTTASKSRSKAKQEAAPVES